MESAAKPLQAAPQVFVQAAASERLSGLTGSHTRESAPAHIQLNLLKARLAWRAPTVKPPLAASKPRADSTR